MMARWTHADAVRQLTVERDLANQRAKVANDELNGAEAHVALLKASLKQSAEETAKAEGKAELNEGSLKHAMRRLESLRDLVDDITDMDFDDPEIAFRIIRDRCREAQKDWTYGTVKALDSRPLPERLAEARKGSAS